MQIDFSSQISFFQNVTYYWCRHVFTTLNISRESTWTFLTWIETLLSLYIRSSKDDLLSVYTICKDLFYKDNLFWLLREKCLNTEFFLVRIFLYLNWIQVNPHTQSKYRKIRARKNSQFGHFSRSACWDHGHQKSRPNNNNLTVM